MTHLVKAPKKLIEVALPLDAINAEAAREKSIRHGHPSTLHLWWARRPLAAARAVIFGQLVNDPSWRWELEHPGEAPPNYLKGSWAASRKRLFELITELVKWENTTNEEVLNKARAEIRKSWRETCEVNKDHPDATTLFDPDRLPGLHDPFAGGGTIPLEAQRLGLDAIASDLNPVAVLINKAMIEIPPKFTGRPPVNPDARARAGMNIWMGAQGIAEDVRYYGSWMREEAFKRIGHLYPPVEVTKEMTEERSDLAPYIGKELAVIAWIWARTVKSPNPAFSHVDVPLVSSFLLGTKEGREVWVEPVVREDTYRFVIHVGNAPQEANEGTKVSRGSFRCILSGTPISYEYVDAEARLGRMHRRLLAVVAEGDRGRVYFSPDSDHERIEKSVVECWQPEIPSRGTWASNAQGRRYGFDTFGDYFIPRQLVALTTFADLVGEVRRLVLADSLAAGMDDDLKGVEFGGCGATAYSESVSVYLALAVDRSADYWSSLATWHSGKKMEAIRNTFGRQGIAMTWDFAEASPFSGSSGNWTNNYEWCVKSLASFPAAGIAKVVQSDAQVQTLSVGRIVSMDPPYYDNIGYADLSDYFYGWLRRMLKPVFPELFATLAVPKTEELVATTSRHGSKEQAERFFFDGMTRAFSQAVLYANDAYPVTIYYAFKESDSKSEVGTYSTGWDTFLGALVRVGLSIVGTWPMRTELGNRMVGSQANALASSIILVCRKRRANTPTATRRQFMRELNAVLPVALDEMTMGVGEDRSPVAPVDLAQAMIGPGMAVFSKYSAVLEADGTPMSVKTALQLINRFFADDDFDADTQFCLRWFEQHNWDEGQFGEADVLARAKGTAVSGLVEAGVVESEGGRVRLRKQSEYPADWDPTTDKRLPVWEALHQLIRAFRADGERGAGVVLAAVKDKTDSIRQLAYRMYTLCERRGQAEEARGYNDIVTAWSSVEQVAETVPQPAAQLGLRGVE